MRTTHTKTQMCVCSLFLAICIVFVMWPGHGFEREIFILMSVRIICTKTHLANPPRLIYNDDFERPFREMMLTRHYIPEHLAQPAVNPKAAFVISQLVLSAF